MVKKLKNLTAGEQDGWEKFLGQCDKNTAEEIMKILQEERRIEKEWRIKTVHTDVEPEVKDYDAMREIEDYAEDSKGHDDESTEKIEDPEVIKTLETLQQSVSTEQYQMLLLRYGYGLSTRKVAGMMGCSHERVRLLTDMERIRKILVEE